VHVEITESIKIEEDLKTKTLERAKFEGLDKYEWRLKDPKDYYFGKL
jgi:ribosomal silencing factor RsfS